MAFFKNAIHIFGRTKTIGVISIIAIIAISYGLFFYLQNATESNIRNSLFEQQKQRQLDSTKAISERISSDLDSIMSRLQGLANSVYLQQGDLSSNKTIKLMKEYYLPVSTSFTTDRLLILNTSDISVEALALKGEQIFKGVNFSYRDWVGQTKSTFMPVFSNGYEGRDGKYRIAITYPIVNRETGKYIGLVAALIPTIQFFQHYGNIYNINSQYLAVLDRQSVQLIHPLKTFVGTPFFGKYAQEVTGHNTVLNNLIRKVMSGQPDFAVYDFINGQRLTTGYPIFVEGVKPIYFVFVITPTSTIYSQINNVISTERIEMFSLLAGVTAAIAVVILFLIRWSSTLEMEVKRRTKESDESNQRLEEANQQLKLHDKVQHEFINIAAHELRTPIQPILSATDILRSKIIDTNQRNLLDVTIRNAKRLQRLSDDILDVTRIESGTLKLSKERFDLFGEIQNVIKDIKTQIPATKEIQITLSPSDKPDGPIYIEADKVRIYQVISNLLSNAIKFTDKGGPISISVKIRELTEAENKKKDVIVSIRDTGVGISSEIIDRLFSKFATKSDTGTGLGLFISKSIIEAHGGRIWAENNADGKGATFSFSLPSNY